MRNSEDSFIKTRIRKRKRAKKRRFSAMVIFMLIMAYCISYGIVKNDDTEKVRSYRQQNTLANESMNKNSSDSDVPVNKDKADEDIADEDMADEGTENYEIVNENAVPMEEGGQIEVPTPMQFGENLLTSKALEVNPKYAVIVRELQNYLKSLDGKYGIYFLNLKDGSEFGINHKDRFTAASTIKIPINLYLFKKIKEGAVNPKGMLTYERKDYETGTGIIQKSSFGKRYTVRELSKKSIEISDNVATNMLLRLLGMDNVKNYMRQLGGTVVVDDQNVTCPEDMGIYMREVYSFYKQDKTLGNELMGYFLNTTSSDRIPALLPKNVKIAHKIGNQVKTMNDVGIVFSREPYIISILSKDVNENEAVGVIAEISKKVYDFAK